MKKFKVKKGDQVVVISGKDKGKRGKVTRVITDKAKVLVEGVNQVKRHVRPSQMNPQGGILEKEAPIHVSNVMLLDPDKDAPTRVGRKFVEGKKGKKGAWVRVSKKSGHQFDEATA